MEISQIQHQFTPRPERKSASEPVMEDSAAPGQKGALKSLSTAPLASDLFKSRETLWESEWKGGSGVSKGIVKVPGAGIFAGTYCDIALIGTKDGKTLWDKDIQKKGNCNVSTSPAVPAQDGSLLVGTTDGRLFSLDPVTGGEKWSYNTGSYTTVPAQASDGTIYVQKDKDIVALNADGTEKFQVPLGLERHTIDHIDTQGSVYVKSDNDIYAIGPYGSRLWQIKGNDVTSLPDDSSHLFVTASKNVPVPDHKGATTLHTLVSAREPRTGDVIWEKEYDWAQVAGGQKGLVFVGGHKEFMALDAATGEEVWKNPVDMKREIKGFLDNGTIVTASAGKFEALDAATGKIKWSLPTKDCHNSSQALMTSRGSLLISDSSTLYCVDPEKGDVQMTIKVDKGIRNLCLSDDESVIYAENTGTGAVEAIDFRTPAEAARDMLENAQDPAAPDDSTIDIDDDYIIIDDIKLPRKKES